MEMSCLSVLGSGGILSPNKQLTSVEMSLLHFYYSFVYSFPLKGGYLSVK
jgi:hypothetical protein